MKSIEEIKIELTLKKLSGAPLRYEDIKNLPPDDDLRTFVCSLSSYCSYVYAKEVDEGPFDETRTASCGNSAAAFLYAKYIDKCSRDDTREAAYRDPSIKRRYQDEVEKLDIPIGYMITGIEVCPESY